MEPRMEERMKDKQEIFKKKMARFHTSPQDWFRLSPELYSKFDENGLPTHDASGNEFSKSSTRKLQKDWEKQNKLYKSM